MRTKSLCLAATVLAGGILAASAQVYSLNIVGYVNVEVKPGYNLVANPLDNGAGNISSNLVPDTLPVNSQVLIYTPGSGYSPASTKKASGWTPVYTIPPGTGYFLRNVGASTLTNTYVGSVNAFSVTNDIRPGYNLKGSLLPIASVSSNVGPNTLNLPTLPVNSQVLLYNNPGGYAPASTKKASGWTPVYTINVGQGFFVRSLDTATNVWTQQITP